MPGPSPTSHGVFNRLLAAILTLADVIRNFWNSEEPKTTANLADMTQSSSVDRVAMTTSCKDAANIPKVSDAGQIFERDGQRLQRMHEGSLVMAGGYHGEWMSQIIKHLRGHHEPQEELLFHEILKHVAPNSCIVELGAFWAYYTSWFLGRVKGGSAVCVEPDENNMKCGMRNLALNGRRATWINAAVGGVGCEDMIVGHGTDGREVKVPCLDMNALRARVSVPEIEILHLDVQGAELDFLRSLDNVVTERALRFVFVSTHHSSISGSQATHQECISELQRLGAMILADHTIEESFSGDGLIVASFRAEDAHIRLPEPSRNTACNSLFGGKPGTVGLADADLERSIGASR